MSLGRWHLSTPWNDWAMIIRIGLGKTSRAVDRCFVWDMQELGPFIAISDKHVGKVKGNDDQTSSCSQSHLAGESSELNWKCLQQFRRITITCSPAWRRLQGWSKGQRSSRSFLLCTCWGLGCYLPRRWLFFFLHHKISMSHSSGYRFTFPSHSLLSPRLSSARTMQEGQGIFINLQWFIMPPL